uniref:Uncharacterized protein n=1 Tax=Setaria digitata TaxID=48799 RepID=A0A915PQ22_9BILA
MQQDDILATPRPTSPESTLSESESGQELRTALSDSTPNLVDLENDDMNTERGSSDTQSDSSEKRDWKAICYNLEQKLELIQADAAIHVHAFVEMKEMLRNAERKIGSMQMVIAQKEEENAKLSDIIEKLQIKSVEELDKQKNELIRSTQTNLMTAEQLYRASEAKVFQLEALLEKAHVDNMELHKRLDKAIEGIRNAKSESMDGTEFQRRLRNRLMIITEKFKIEAADPDLAWMGEENIRHAIDGFEVAVNIILNDDPHLRPWAERITIFAEAKSEGPIGQTLPSEITIGHGYLDPAQTRTLMDVKMQLSKELHYLLDKQMKEFREIIWKIMSRLEIAEQKVDSSLVKRMDDFGEVLGMIDHKQCELQKIRTELEDIGLKLETFFEALDEYRHEIKVLSDERNRNLECIREQKFKLKTTCAYVDYLSNEHLKLEKQVKNIELQFEKLAKELHDHTTSVAQASNPVGHQANVNGNAHPPVATRMVRKTAAKENEQQVENSGMIRQVAKTEEPGAARPAQRGTVGFDNMIKVIEVLFVLKKLKCHNFGCIVDLKLNPNSKLDRN